MVGLVVIFALAGALAVVPPLIDRWALPRGASPQTLAALAAITLFGVVAVPVTFAVCTGSLAAHDHDLDGLSLASASGLLLVAVAAGRTTARMLRIRRRWAAVSHIAEALDFGDERGAVKVLPVGELLAFTSGTEAFVSQGLVERLTPAQLRAVIEHEREHAQRRHARLLGAASAVAHGTFGAHPARHAAAVLDRELDALADQAAANTVGDPRPVQDALRALAAADPGEGMDTATRARIERLAPDHRGPRRPVELAVRLVALTFAGLLLASICLSTHASSAWLGVTACLLFVAGFVSLIKPALRARTHPSNANRTLDA